MNVNTDKLLRTMINYGFHKILECPLDDGKVAVGIDNRFLFILDEKYMPFTLKPSQLKNNLISEKVRALIDRYKPYLHTTEYRVSYTPLKYRWWDTELVVLRFKDCPVFVNSTMYKIMTTPIIPNIFFVPSDEKYPIGGGTIVAMDMDENITALLATVRVDEVDIFYFGGKKDREEK